jgi:hypothetical protein
VTTRPTHQTSAGRMYLALQKKARAEGRTTDELLQLQALEAFLERLVASRHAMHFSLKGGVLLLAYGLRRPTRDVDLSTNSLPNELALIRAIIDEIAQIPSDDGWELRTLRAETIREGDEYSGIRVTLQALLASARQEFHVDVSFGDPVSPPPLLVSIERLLGGALMLRGHPLAMIFAEKMVTALQRGAANTRWRDFADIFLLLRSHAVSADVIGESVRRVATARGASLGSMSLALEGYADLAQTKWAAWVRKQRLHDRVPLIFGELLSAIFDFADPLLEGTVAGCVWDPGVARWYVA